MDFEHTNPPDRVRFNLDPAATAQYENMVANASTALLGKHHGDINNDVIYSALLTIQVLLLQHAHLMSEIINNLGEIMSTTNASQTVINDVVTSLQALDATIQSNEATLVSGLAGLNDSVTSLDGSVTNITNLLAGLKADGVDTTALQSEVSTLQSDLTSLAGTITNVATATSNIVTSAANVAAIAPATPPVSTTASLDPDNQLPLYTFASGTTVPDGYVAVTDFTGDNNAPLYTFGAPGGTDVPVASGAAVVSSGQADAVYTGGVTAVAAGA